MSELSPSKPQFRAITGVHYSTNHEAQLLEQHLGIRFDQHPGKVELSLRNRLVIFLRDPYLRTSLGLKRGNVLRTEKPNYHGQYAADYHTFFLATNSTEPLSQVSLHENMHGFILEQNPLFRREYWQPELTVNEPSGTVTKIGMPFEQQVILMAFDEGLSDWGTVESWLQQSDGGLVNDTTDYSYLRNIVHTEAIRMKTKNHQDKVGAFSEKLRDYEQLYSLGHFFSLHAINYLRGIGLSSAEALGVLIQNPPKTYEQIKQPLEFAKIIV
jgi:hypothetical protein